MNNKCIMLALLLLISHQNCSTRRFDFSFIAQQTTMGIVLNITRNLCYFSQLEYDGPIEGDQYHTFSNLRSLTKKDIVQYKIQSQYPFQIYSNSLIKKGSIVGFNATMCCYPAMSYTIMDYEAYLGGTLMYSGEVNVTIEMAYPSSSEGWRKSIIGVVLLWLFMI